jgi:hypothetical protein
VAKPAVLLTSGSRSTAEVWHDAGPAHIGRGLFPLQPAGAKVPGAEAKEVKDNHWGMELRAGPGFRLDRSRDVLFHGRMKNMKNKKNKQIPSRIARLC